MRWTGATTVQARASPSKQKSIGQGEVCADTLQGRSAEALRAIYEMLKAHFDQAHQSPMTCVDIRLFLIPKVRHPVGWDIFRVICLLNVLSNMYMAGVMCLIRDCVGGASSGLL